MPVGSLEQLVILIQRAHVEIEPVFDTALGEAQAALPRLEQRIGRRRIDAEQRGQVVYELVGLISTPPEKVAENAEEVI